MIFDGAQIAAATGGVLVHPGPMGSILTDSRRVAPGSWFVALTGDRFDGHDFLAFAAAAGAAGVVASRPPPEPWPLGLVIVPDTLVALQDLARAARRLVMAPVVGITGSAGKTSTRVMVVEVLRALGHVHHTQGNLNNHIGLPMTLLATPPDANVVVLELGMNHPGEIALLADIARPGVRLITNVGAAHVEGCGSIEGVARAKQELFDTAEAGDLLCVNLDDPRIAAMPRPVGTRVLTYGTGESAVIRLTHVEVDAARLQTRVRMETPLGEVRATIGVPGAHLAHNAAAAVAVAVGLGLPIETMGPALGRFVPEGMRNRVEQLNGITLLDDAYNANPVSMGAALRTLGALASGGRRFAVLGDMFELGESGPAAHAEVLRTARSGAADRVLVTGILMRGAADEVGGIEVYDDAEQVGAVLCAELRPGDVVLVKGSRGAKMERIIDSLRRHVGGRG